MNATVCVYLSASCVKRSSLYVKVCGVVLYIRLNIFLILAGTFYQFNYAVSTVVSIVVCSRVFSAVRRPGAVVVVVTPVATGSTIISL